MVIVTGNNSLTVSATRRKREIKIPSCLSAHVRKNLIYVTTMDTRNSVVFPL